jgi:hypothetical protein
MNEMLLHRNGLHDTTTANLTPGEIQMLVTNALELHLPPREASKYSALGLNSMSLADPQSLKDLLTDALGAGLKFKRIVRSIVTLSVLIAPRFHDGASVISHSDPGFEGGTVLLTVASGYCYVLDHDGTRVFLLSQADLHSDETPREGETVTVRHKGPASVLHAEGGSVVVMLEDGTLDTVPLSEVVSAFASAPRTWPPNVLQRADAVESPIYTGELAGFRTSEVAYTGTVVALDTDRVVIHDSKGPRPVYYVVARDTAHRIDEDDDAEPRDAKRICTRAIEAQAD